MWLIFLLCLLVFTAQQCSKSLSSLSTPVKQAQYHHMGSMGMSLRGGCREALTSGGGGGDELQGGRRWGVVLDGWGGGQSW